MQIQIFKNRAERVGDTVLKLDLTAILAAADGSAIMGKKMLFNWVGGKNPFKEAITNEDGEVKTGIVLVELPPDDKA
ncbi:MAG: hypothetical protein HQK55_16030, partial [Deltaproteobacteria bacterium]|nr:hypothetical protein [Deltaproteobacteria bacterium]